MLEDPYIDCFQPDDESVTSARRLTVIFSAFHKILYHREKILARRAHYRSLKKDYVDFHQLLLYKREHKGVVGLGHYDKLDMTRLMHPIPLVYTNKVLVQNRNDV